jgi:hypothetical protein
MSNLGGKRAGAGAKRGQGRVMAGELRAAFEKGLGIPYPEHLSEVYQKLFNDFKNNKNVKEFIMFNENMNKRLLANPDNDATADAIRSLTKEEIEQRIANLTTRAVLSTPVESTSTDSTDLDESQ